MIFNLTPFSGIRLASPSAPGLRVGCIADNHVTVDKHEWLLDKLEGLQAESIGASGGGEELNRIINGTAVESTKIEIKLKSESIKASTLNIT